jgi:hypothetical protein
VLAILSESARLQFHSVLLSGPGNYACYQVQNLCSVGHLYIGKCPEWEPSINPDDMESKNLISRNEKLVGERAVNVYKLTVEGTEFCNSVLEPYEKMFPRKRLTKIDNRAGY